MSLRGQWCRGRGWVVGGGWGGREVLFLLEKRARIMFVAKEKLQAMCLENMTLVCYEIYLFGLISAWLPTLLHITAIPFVSKVSFGARTV